MITYKHNKYNDEVCSVSKFDNDVFICCIPFDPANTDYQEYLKWLEEGNTPLPAEEPTE